MFYTCVLCFCNNDSFIPAGVWADCEVRQRASDCVGQRQQPGCEEVLQRGTFTLNFKAQFTFSPVDSGSQSPLKRLPTSDFLNFNLAGLYCHGKQIFSSTKSVIYSLWSKFQISIVQVHSVPVLNNKQWVNLKELILNCVFVFCRTLVFQCCSAFPEYCSC